MLIKWPREPEVRPHPVGGISMSLLSGEKKKATIYVYVVGDL